MNEQIPNDLVEDTSARQPAGNPTTPVAVHQYDVPDDLHPVGIDPKSSVGMYQQIQPILQQAQDKTNAQVLQDIGPDQGMVGGVKSLGQAVGHLFNPTSLTDPSQVGANNFTGEIVNAIKQGIPQTAQPSVDWEAMHNSIQELPPEVKQMVYKDQYLAEKQYQQAKIIRQTGEEAQYMATLPFFMPQRMIMGNIVRATNPELMDRVRIDNEKLDRSPLLKSLDEIAPPLYLGSDVVQKKVTSLLTNVGGPGEAALNTIAPIAGAVAGLGTDIVTDPMTWLSFGADSIEATGAKLSKEGDFLKIVMPNAEPVYLDAEKNLYRVLPDMNKTEKNAVTIGAGSMKLAVKGDTVQKYAEAIKSVAANASIGWGKMEIKPGVFLQGFATNTSNDAFNMARNVNRNEIGLGHMIAEGDMANSFKQVLGDKDLSEGISRYATHYAELGQEGADKISAKMGIRLNDADKKTAIALGETVSDWRKWATDVSSEMTGQMSPMFKPATPQQIEETINSDKNIRTLWENIDPELRPYMFSNNADVGRRASSEGIKAMRQMGESYGAVDATLSDVGLKKTADAFKEREKLSTWASDLIKSKEYNVKNFYDTNLLGTAQSQVRDVISTAANTKFAKTTVELGKTREEWDAAIRGARALVEQNGVANVSPDVFRLSRLDAGIMQPVNEGAFNSLRGVVNSPGVSPDALMRVNRFGRDKVLFEPSVAGAINSKFSAESKVGLTAMSSWFNSLLTRSQLSSITRVVPQAYEAFTSSFGHASVADYLNAVKNNIRPTVERDFAGKFFQSSGLGQNVSKMDDVGRIALAPKMLLDPGINDAWTTSMKTVKSMIEANQFEKSLTDYAKQAFKTTAGVVEYVGADHWLKRQMRAAVNYFEDIPKEAVFRNQLRLYGDPNKAAIETSKMMMDFRFTSQGVSNYIRPLAQFANYQVKAIERMLVLAGKNPGLVTLFDDRQGHFVRAVNSMNWSPYNVETMRKTFNMPADPVFLSFMPGAEYIAKDKNGSQNTLNNILSAVLGDVSSIGKDSYTKGLVQASKEGFQAMAKLPSFTSGPIDLLRKPFSDRGLGGMASPAINAAAVVLTGRELTTGDQIPLTNQQAVQLESWQKKLEAIKSSTARPFQDRNFWNIYDGVGKMAFEIHAPKINEALESPVMKAALGALGRTETQVNSDMDKMRVDKDHLYRMINTMTAGLIVARDGDLAYNMALKNMLAERKGFLDELKKAALKKDVDSVSKYKGDLRTLTDRIHNIIDYRDAYETQSYKMRQNPSLESDLIGKENQQFEPTDDALIQQTLPVQPGTPVPDSSNDDYLPQDLQSTDRKPQSETSLSVNNDGTINMDSSYKGVDKMYETAIQHAMDKNGIKELTPTMKGNFEQFIKKELEQSPGKFHELPKSITASPKRRIASP